METQQLLNNPEYLAYMKTVDQMIQKLPKTDQLEIRREISSHIYESLLKYPASTINEALQNLGEADTYLKDWVTIRRIRAAANTFNPFRIIGQLLSAIINHSAYAFKYTLFTVLYLLTIAFGSLCIFKIVSPAHTGLLISAQGKVAFGYSSDIAGAHEILGSWFIPVCFFITGLLYMIITHFLKMSMFKNQEKYL